MMKVVVKKKKQKKIEMLMLKPLFKTHLSVYKKNKNNNYW